MSRRHLHFMGIGGVSMGSLARHFHALGFRVSGCDASAGASLPELRALGIEVEVGHDPSHLEGVDTLITTTAVAHDEPELVEARRRGVRVLRRIELLAQLFREIPAIGVTGTHGKSTTSGMIAQILLSAGSDPSVQIGAVLPALAGSMRVGNGDWLVAEVDESDPGFAHLAAEIAVIINLDDDHVAGEHQERRNYHASLADLREAARSFALNAERVVACADWPGLDTLLEGVPDVITFGRSPQAHYGVENVELGPASSRFLLRTPQGERLPVALGVPGLHNVMNAAAALAATSLTGLDTAKLITALEEFRGVGRRWQRWGDADGPMIIDDYAHHPTEVEATLNAARNTGRRVRAVLQPHRWVRTARHWRALADAASLADEIVVLDVYAAGEAAIPGVSPDLIVDRLRDAGKSATYLGQQQAVDYLRETLHADDLVITLGAGDVWQVARDLSASHTAVKELEGAVSAYNASS